MLRNLGDSLSRLGRGAVPGETWHGDYGPHLRGRRQFDRSRRARSKNASKGVLADRLIFQQGIGKRIELCARGAQELAYDLETFGDQVFHLVIDPSGRGVAVLAPLRQLIPEKRLFLIDLERHWPKAPHAPPRDHASDEPRRLHQVVFGSRGDVAERERLRRAAAEHDIDTRQEVGPAVVVPLFRGPLLGHPERLTMW